MFHVSGYEYSSFRFSSFGFRFFKGAGAPLRPRGASQSERPFATGKRRSYRLKDTHMVHGQTSEEFLWFLGLGAHAVQTGPNRKQKLNIRLTPGITVPQDVRCIWWGGDHFLGPGPKIHSKIYTQTCLSTKNH